MDCLSKNSLPYINDRTFFDSLTLKHETPYALLLFHLEKQEQLFLKNRQLQEIEKQIEQLIVQTRLTETYKKEIYHLSKKINDLKMKAYMLQRKETGLFNYLIHYFNHALRTACEQELRISHQKMNYFHEQTKALQANPLFEEFLYEKQQLLSKECAELHELLAHSKMRLCHIYFRFLTNQETMYINC